MTETPTRIDLSQFRTPGSIVFSGRPRGEDLRRKLNLDEFDRDPGKVEVIIPDEIVSVNSSFFLGLFGPSVRFSRSEPKFLARYDFKCSDAALASIRKGIHEALVRSDVFASE
jgi:hypothetical protein